MPNRKVSGIRNTKYKILNTSYRKSRGFTLIELLVVIAIIGILASFAIASFTSAQAKGRDSRRKSDLDAIMKALELMRGDSTGSKYYPRCDSGSFCDLTSTSTNPDMANTYIKAVPTDPSTKLPYQYVGLNCTGSGCTGWSTVICIENINDPARLSDDGDPFDNCDGEDGWVAIQFENP